MNVSLIDGGCFGWSVSPALVWMIALNIAAMNVTLGRCQSRSLWWSVPYSVCVAAFAVVSYLPDAIGLMDFYRETTALATALDPVFYPVYGVMAAAFVAPAAGLAFRAVNASR